MASSIQGFLNSASERMQKSVDHFQSEIRGIRTGRATPGLIENVRVDYYGSPTPLSQLASVTAPDARSLAVKPFDPGAMSGIEKAILSSGMGLNPSAEGGVLRISIPPLSEDQRMKLAGRVKALAEEAKISIRNVRRDVLREVEAASKDSDRDVSVTEDDVQTAKSSIQDVLKASESRVGDLCASKSEEIMDA